MGREPFVCINAMSASRSHVCVLSKVSSTNGEQVGAESVGESHAPTGADAATYWNVYVLQKPDPSSLYSDMVRESNVLGLIEVVCTVYDYQWLFMWFAYQAIDYEWSNHGLLLDSLEYVFNYQEIVWIHIGKLLDAYMS